MKVKAPKLTANNLTKQALRVFDLCGFECWRQNNNAVWDAKKKVFRANSVRVGQSDIIGYHRKTGVFLAAEIKVGNDKLSAAQVMFLTGVERAGGVGITVRSIEDLGIFLQSHNGFKSAKAK